MKHVVRRVMQTVTVVAAASTLSTIALSGPAAAQKPETRGATRVLIVKYEAKKDCVVVPNYPRGTTGGRKVVPKGQAINWRYNVNARVAAVSIPNEDDRPGGGFPWWGFVQDRSCLGKSLRTVRYYERKEGKHWVKVKITYPAGKAVPKRRLQGRSQYKNGKKGYFRRVDWRPSHGKIPARRYRMPNNATLRDAPVRFVIGNVYRGWTVRTTSTKPGWHRVYVPAIKRWGYVLIRG